MKLSVIVPTIQGREDSLERTLDAYRQTVSDEVEVELVIVHDERNWPTACNRGQLDATGDILHFGADDLVPYGNWLAPCLPVLAGGILPAPYVYNLVHEGNPDNLHDGEPGNQTDFTRVPILTRHMADTIGPWPDINYYCVPTTHRALTRTGWATIDEIELGDLLMVFDPWTHEMRWEPCLAVNRFPFQGALLRLRRKGDDFQFTFNHRWPLLSHKGQPLGLGEAREGLRLPIRGEYTGRDSVLSPRLAAILGWVVGDGTYNKKQRAMVVYQSERSEHRQEITALLEREPQNGVIGTDVRTWRLRLEDKHAIEALWRGKEDTPRVAAGLSREAAEAMLTALWRAEGNYTNAGGRVIGQSQTANPEVREAIQILALMTGANGSLHEKKSVFLKTSRSLVLTPNALETSWHEGEVWCPTTPTGTWIMEHAGGAIPTGNSDNWVSAKARLHGWPTHVVGGYEFVHFWHQTGRLDGPEYPIEQYHQQYVEELRKLGLG